MADISQELGTIGSATLGSQIRQSIYNALSAINSELVTIESSLDEGITQLQETASRLENEST